MARSQSPYVQPPQTLPPSSLVETTLADFLKRNARLILGTGFFVTFWMLVYTFTIYAPNFAAKSLVIIKDSAITSRYIEPDRYYALQTTSSNSSNPVLNTMGILKSGAISDALWNYFHSKHPEQLEKLHIKTQKDWNAFYQDGTAFIKAKNQPGTDLIAIQFSWSDPVIAKEALTVVIGAFQDASRNLNKEEQVTRTQFLSAQVGEIEKQLADIRQQKSKFQSAQHTVSIRQEGEDLAGSRMELNNKLNQLESLARGKENAARKYQQLLGMSPETALKASALGQNSTMVRLQDELYRLQQHYALLSASLTESNPKVREVQAQIDQVNTSIDAEQVRTLGKPHTKTGIVADGTRNTLISNMLQAQADSRDLRTQAMVVRQRLNQINRDISAFPGTAEALATLEQKETSLSTALDQLRQKVLEGKLKEEQTLSNVFIVDAPRLPDKAQFPTRSHLIVLSLLLGAGVGLATAFAKEQLLLARPPNLPDWQNPSDDDHADSSHGNGNGNGNGHRKPYASSPIPPAKRLLVTPGLSAREEQSVPDAILNTILPPPSDMQSVSAPNQQPQPEFRHDLTRPLAATPPANALAPEPMPAASIAPTPESMALLLDADLLPPEPEPAQVAKSVKLATPLDIDTALALQQRLAKSSQPGSLQADLAGIPVLHAAPSPEPPQPEESPMASTSVEQQAAQTMYESHAQAMPLPRRRSLPAFLLDESDEADSAPYTLVPKKQLLAADDNLMQDMAPLDLPLDPPLDMSWDDGLTTRSPIPAFMQEDRPNPSRRPLMGNLLRGKKQERHPKILLGVGTRAQQKMELPSSLSRIMQTMERNPVTMDS